MTILIYLIQFSFHYFDLYSSLIYYINMNKKRQINVNLNTINIPYTMKLNSDRIQKSIISSPPGRI